MLAAFEPELRPLRGLLEGRDSSEVSLESVGIGLVEAAVGTTRLLERLRPERVFFIGSVGTSDLGLSLLSLVTAQTVTAPGFKKRVYSADESLLQILKEQAELCKVYSTLEITRDPELALRLAEQTGGSSCESLELFAVAAACEAFEVPWASISAVTNYLSPEGQKEWEENHLRAAEATAEALAPLL